MKPDGQWVYTVLSADGAVQLLGIAFSIIGVLCTVYAIVEFSRAFSQANVLQKMLARNHIVGQVAVLAVQLLFLVVNSLVVYLPEIPLAMYQSNESGQYVVLVIMTRKLLRLAMIAILAVGSIHRVWSFHRVIFYLSTMAHQHRRATDLNGGSA